MYIDRADYFSDSWNYLELAGNAAYFTGAILDLVNEEMTDELQIVASMSVMFTLAKIVYLIRVFRNLNFLVTMFITVVQEIFYFMILFTIFIFTFAESFHVLQVDRENYGRTPDIMAHFIQVFRCAMGDFSIININYGFDMIDNPELEGDAKYKFSRPVMLYTFLVFIISCFFVFIIFMNFIIAVISESYSTVIKNKEAFDYQQRASMINERETYFNSKHLEDEINFPKFIIVRRLKENAQ